MLRPADLGLRPGGPFGEALELAVPRTRDEPAVGELPREVRCDGH